MALTLSDQSPLFLGKGHHVPAIPTGVHVGALGSPVLDRGRRTGRMRKEPKPELTWVLKQIEIAPQLKDSPPDLASGFSAHIAWISDYGHNTFYRAHNNLSGIPFCAISESFGGSLGFPDAYGRIARFSNLAAYVDCYLYTHGHLLKLSAREFFAHMQRNDLTTNAVRRWGKIVETWENHFAQ